MKEFDSCCLSLSGRRVQTGLVRFGALAKVMSRDAGRPLTALIAIEVVLAVATLAKGELPQFARRGLAIGPVRLTAAPWHYPHDATRFGAPILS